MKFILCIFCYLSFATLQAATPVGVYQEIEALVQELHLVNGNYLRGQAPKVIISEIKNNGASYNPLRHTLTVDLEIHQICQSFGEQSKDALAFIIGHELAHCYMEHPFFSKFNKYDKCKGATLNPEQSADIYGLFNAYLAGYQSFKLIPKIISTIYEKYKLEDELSGYPTKQKRMQVAKEVQAQIKELIAIYEAANYLSAIGEYALAAASYEHLLTFYQGKEIYNNLAVNHILEALHFTEKDIDLYLFPLELDWDLRIKKPKKDKGDSDLTVAELNYRTQQLDLARLYIEKAAQLDPGYVTADINRICILTLQKRYKEAITHYHQLLGNGKLTSQKVSEIQKESILLSVAIAKAHLPENRAEAIELLAKLSATKHEHIAFQAKYNLKILEEGICGAAASYYCFEPIQKPKYVDDVRLHRQLNLPEPTAFAGDYTIAIQYLENSRLFQYKKGTAILFKFQQTNEKAASKPDELEADEKYKMIDANNGYFIVCEEKRLVFYMSSSNEIISWGQYYR